MKHRIVICVLIYFELAASYPYGEEYIEADQHPSQHILFSNSVQPQNVPPAFNSQNGFNLQSTRPYFDNVAAYRASDVPLETGMDLKPVTQQGQNYDNYLLAKQRNNLPVQRPLPDQRRLNNEFLENQAKLQNIPQFQPQFADGPNLELANQRNNLVVQRPLPDQQRLTNEFLQFQAKLQNVPQFQPQFADGPNLNEVRESYVNPVLRQYQPVSSVENIEKPAAFRPQYRLNEQYQPLINMPSMQQTSNNQELQNGPMKIREVNSNIGVVEKNNVHHLPSDLQISRATGDDFQFLYNQPKFKEILATTKNKKRYMIIYPNGEVEHVDSIEDIVAKNPNHLVFNAADINQLTTSLRHPSLSSSNIPQSPAIPLKSNLPSSPVVLPPTFSSQSSQSLPRQPAIPFKSNAQSSSGLLPPVNSPQLTSLNIQRPPAMQLKSDVPLSPVMLPSSSPPQSNISRPPTIPVKTNAPTSSVVLSPTHSPQATSSNISPPASISLRTNAPTSSIVKPSTFSSQSTSSNKLSQPSNPPFKSSQLSPVVQPPPISSQFTSTLASTPEVVSNTPMALPSSPDTPILPKITSETNTKTPIPTSTKPHISPKQKPSNDLPLPQQLSSTPIASSDTTKIGVIPDQYPKLTNTNSTHPISNVHTKATPSVVLPAPKKTPMISKNENNWTPPEQVQNSSSMSTINNEINTIDHLSVVDSNNKNKTSDSNELSAEVSPTAESKINNSATKIDHSAKTLPLTITEIKSSNNSAVTTSSPSDNISNQNIVSNDIPKNSTLGDKENDFNHSSLHTVPKPVAMISPTPATPLAPIDLADLFPIVKEDNPKIPEVSKSTKKQNETTDSTKLATRKSSIELNHNDRKDENKSSGDSNTDVSTESDTTISSSDDEKHEVNAAAANVSTSSFAHEDRKESEEINSKNNLSTSNFSQKTEVQSEPEELTNYSDNQITSQIVSDKHAQPVHKTDATFDLPSSLEELSNTDAESTESKVPSIVVDTESATSSSVGSDESSEQSSIVNVDESNHGEENLLDLIQRKKKKNMLSSTPTSYDDIWNKLVEDGFVSMVYFIEMPSHYNLKHKEANEHREQDLQEG